MLKGLTFTFVPTICTSNQIIDLVIVTHFHLDHIGALTMLTEVYDYRGPIYMTHPTKAMAALALKDFGKMLTEKIPEKIRVAAFTDAMVDRCIARVTAIDLHETGLEETRLRLGISSTCPDECLHTRTRAHPSAGGVRAANHPVLRRARPRRCHVRGPGHDRGRLCSVHRRL